MLNSNTWNFLTGGKNCFIGITEQNLELFDYVQISS